MAYKQRLAFLDLINSQEWDGFGRVSEHLDEPVWVDAFLARWGWSVPTTGALPRRELESLRGLLRRLVETVIRDMPLSAADLADLNAFLAVPQRQKLQADNDTYRLESEPLEPGWAWILAQIAASAAAFLAQGELRRLKVCPNPGCRWAFYDGTNANVRRWCDDRTCGNREKVRRYRSRHRE